MEDARPSNSSLLGDWLLEASVLVTVFPVIDQLVATSPVRWSVIGSAQAVALLALVGGVYSKRRR